MALVKLIEHDCRHTFQLRIGEQTAGQQALSDKSHPRARTNRLFEANLISDGFAYRFAEFRLDSTRHQARCDPARLQHDHISAHNTKQRGRHSSSLTRTRSGYDHEVRLEF